MYCLYWRPVQGIFTLFHQFLEVEVERAQNFRARVAHSYSNGSVNRAIRAKARACSENKNLSPFHLLLEGT